MPKIPDCDRSQFYSRDPHLVCAVHPQGVVTEPGRSIEQKCGDFRPDLNRVEEEQWPPLGYYWWDGELYSIRPPGLTPEERLAILDSHPMFTGTCPQCGYHFGESNLPLIHWDCPSCGWVDNSV